MIEARCLRTLKQEAVKDLNKFELYIIKKKAKWA